MKIHKDSTAIINILNHYGIPKGIPADTRQLYISREKHNLKVILKKAGKKSFYILLFLLIYSISKRIRYIMSLTSFKVISPILILACISYFIIINIMIPVPVQKIKTEMAPIAEKKIEAPVFPTIGFTSITTDSPNIERVIINEINMSIRRECRNQKGHDLFSYGVKNTKYTLIGKVNSFGDNLVINVKIMNIQTSRLVKSFTENGSKSDINSMCKNLAAGVVKCYEEIY